MRFLTIAVAVTLMAGCAKARTAPLSTAPSTAAAPTPAVAALHRDLAALLDGPGLQRATWGLAVQSLRTGERLFEHNPDARLVPGSAMKVVTAAAAAAAVGWEYRFTTTVEATGPIEGGTLAGDIVIRGSGDPSTNGDGGIDLVAGTLDALRQRGILHITGRIIGDDNAVEEPRPGLAWSWDDLGTASGTVSGGLNATENVTRLVVRPAPEPGQPARIEPPSNDTGMVILNRTATAASGTAQTLWAERRPGEAGLTIAGTLARDARPAVLTVAVGNPTRWVAALVRSRLVASGIAVEGEAVDADDLPGPVPAGQALLTIQSRPLYEIVAPMLKRSINMYADALLRLATGKDGPRETPAALAAERFRLREWGVPEDAATVVDGSGLSRHNLLSASGLVTVLSRQFDPSGASPLMQALPIAGVDGSLADRMKGTPAAGNVRAKTGAMTAARSLAGYVTTRDGEPLAFVVVVNNYEGAAPVAVTAVDAIAVRLAGFSRR